MTDRRKVRQLLKIWFSLGAIIVIVGYGAFRAKNFAEGPRISILSPETGTSVGDSLVEIKGTAKNISFLTLNDAKIFTDESGMFDEKILLSYGYNIMTLKARDRFGREDVKTLELIYK